MALVGGFDVDAFFHQPLDDEVLDQVGGGEMRAPGVQRLEDLLRILLGRQIDHHELHQLPYRVLDLLRTRRHVLGTVEGEPLPRLLGEVAVGVDQAGTSVLETAMIHGRRGRHHIVERRAVAVGGPHLELVLGRDAERGRVLHEGLQPQGRLRGTHGEQLCVQRVDQQLQGRQPLLPVDDRPRLQRAHRVLQLLQHDGAKEVRLVLAARVCEETLRHAHDVLPQRLPLVLLVPDVGPLEQRDDQPLRLHEDQLRSSNLGIHQRSSDAQSPFRPLRRGGGLR